MTTISLRGTKVNTAGTLPEIGSKAPGFTLVASDLSEINLESFLGKNVVLNIFPSIDTPVCALSVRKFNAEAGSRENTKVVCVSADLPFAHSRFCGAEGLSEIISASTFRNTEFGKDYGVEMIDGALRGLLSRAVVIIDEKGDVIYTEQVKEISEEPDYESALKTLK